MEYPPPNAAPVHRDPSYSAPEPPARLNPSRPVVTYGLIAANVLVFLLMLLSGMSITSPDVYGMVRWGAMFGPLVHAGQWWRLFTACFLHFGIIHIGFNMYVLYQIGFLVESLFGGALYLLLYLVAGVGGNVIGLYLHPMIVSAGASGAIFGVYGGLLGYLLINRRALPSAGVKAVTRSVMVFLGYNLVFGLADRNTDLTAHIGGLAVGFLAGMLLAKAPPGLRRVP